MPSSQCAATAHEGRFGGGDFETPGVFEAALQVRAPERELVFLSVGDTRDHRRQYKDPALRTISIDFLLTLLANLPVHALGCRCRSCVYGSAQTGSG